MSRPGPDREFVAPVAKYRLRYAKRGRVRFASHRDFQRAFERALRRAGVPMAYSAGFNPRPKVSYANAAPTGTASEAEYLEIGVSAEVPAEELRRALDDALPVGFDLVDAVPVATGDFAHRLEASVWEVRLPDVSASDARRAIVAFLETQSVEVQRMMKNGLRTFDIRPAVLSIMCAEDERGYAILTLVVQHGTPTVRPDDVLVGLAQVTALAPSVPPVVTRLAQGPLAEDRTTVTDPLAPDRAAQNPQG